MRTDNLPLLTCKIAMLMLCIFTGIVSHAGHEKFNVRHTKEAVTTGLETRVMDDKYDYMKTNANWSSQFVNHAITNKVTLAIDPYGTAVMNEAFSVVAMVEVEYDVWDAAANGFVKRVRQQELSINYTVAGAYKDKSTLFIDRGGNHMVVRVLDYYTTPAALGFVPNIELVAEIDVERYYAFNATRKNSNRLKLDASTLETRNELMATWDVIPGAEEYDLEWVWINGFNKDGNIMEPGEISFDPQIFKLNSTRITTTNAYFNIPMIYEPGYLLVRYRPVGKDPLTNYKQNLPGSWSSETSDCESPPVVACWPDHFLFSGFATDKNWQVAVDYIEEGRNKSRIDYYDATLTSRQQQIRLNSTNKVLVGETIFDREGRGSISILPTPVDKQNLTYADELNKNANGVAYSYKDFQDEGIASCITASPLNTETGASNYYSPANPNKEGHQAFLPDAHGYPFIQSTFTPDKLGRMKAQSTPGKDHKIGSGHETKYYYGVPNQEELDRLFGHDVGLYKNYRKNTTIDANGQVQVAYMDAGNRVIASGLAGDAPASLDPIAGASSRAITLNMLDQRNEMEMTSFTRSHLVTKQSNQDLHYKITGTKFETECELPDNDEERCYNCVVDVALTMTDECGDQILSPLNGDSQVTTVGTVSPECVDEVGTFEKNQTVPLNVGTYAINRTISINQRALDAYTADYLDPAKNTCLLTIEDFIGEETASIDVDIEGCNVTCESCLTQLGVYENWNINPYNIDFNPQCKPCLKEEEYQAALRSCRELCITESKDCEGRLMSLLTDVNKNGQYGTISSVGGPAINDDGDLNLDAVTASNASDVNIHTSPDDHPLSVFNENNKLPGISYNNNMIHSWRTPYDVRHITHIWGAPHYYTGNTIDYIRVSVLSPEEGSDEPARYIPDIIDELKSENPVIGKDIYVEPQDLKNVVDFLKYWRDDWKWAMVGFHPEYVYYLECVTRQKSNDFDMKLMSISKIDSAYKFLNFTSSAANLPNPTKNDPAQSLDPYFSSNLTINPGYVLWEFSMMKYYMTNYISNPTIGMTNIWNMAHITANCPAYNASETSCPSCLNTFDGINTDEEWVQFRSYYVGLKQKIQDYKSRLMAIKADRYNGCIGEENFDPGSFGIFDLNSNNTLSPFYEEYEDAAQTCNSERAPLFKDKVKRFTSSLIMAGYDTKKAQCYQSIPIQNARENGEMYTVNFPVLDEVSQCQQVNEDLLKESVQTVDRILFETCGQCPLARDMQTLIDGISRETKNTEGDVTRKSRLVLTASDLNNEIDPINPAFYLSCYPYKSQYPEFTPDLERGLALTGTGAVVWKQLSATSKQVNATISRVGNPTPCTVTLKVDPFSEYTINEVRGLCCFHYEETPTMLPVQLYKNFAMEGLVEVENPKNGQPPIVKVPMEGVSCVNIAQCPMPPVCKLIPDAEVLEAVFDALASKRQLMSAVNLSTTAPYKSLIKDRLRSVGEGTLNWSATQSGSQLNATISSSNGGQQTIQLFLPSGSPINFSHVTGFEGIQSDNISDNPDNTDNQFTIYVLATLPNGTKASYKVKGRTSFSISECRAVGSVEGTLTAKSLE